MTAHRRRTHAYRRTTNAGDGRNRLSRRHLILGAGAVTAGSVLAPYGLPGTPHARAATGDQYDAMRSTWVDLLIGGDVDASDPAFRSVIDRIDDEVASTIELIDRSADRPGVFVDMPFIEDGAYEGSSRIPLTLSRLQRMATAMRTPGSRFEDDADVLADVLAGMDTTNRLIFHAGRDEFGNWYHWEISGPNALMNTCALVYEHVPAEALQRYIDTVDHFIPDPHYQYIDERRKLSTGSNRMWLCEAVAIRGVVGRDEERITRARDGLTDVFVYVDGGDGLYRDGSYLFHAGIPYTGSYGVSFVDRFANQLVLYAGSPWDIGSAEREFAFNTVDLMLAPVVYDNVLMDSIRGRSISRSAGDHGGGHHVSEIVLRLAQAADDETAARWRAMVKGWIERDTYDDPLADASIQRLALFTELLADEAVQAAPEPVNHTLFAQMARAVHRREGWAYAIAMCSARVGRYEVSNGENLKGWHTGEGMTYLYNADNGQFMDGFWPTVDPNRLPGITVDTRPLAENVGVRTRPDSRWVGGSVLGDEFAAVGMELNAMESSLRAKKSWFCLDDRVVALGADITGGGGHIAEAVADAHVNGGSKADDNFGSDNRLLVKKGSPNVTREAYFAFDLSAVPSEVVKATLHVYAQVQDSGGSDVDIDAHGVLDEWDESTLSWNTKPATGPRLDSAHVDEPRRWRVMDVTSHVLERLAAGDEQVSLALKQDPPDGAGLSVWIASREYSTYGYDPYLYLTLAEPTETVETVVENRNLHADGENALTVNGERQPTTLGWSATFEGAHWAHLEGVGGYLFPGGARLHALREERTGSWRDVSEVGSPDPITRRYLTMWVDHGADPDAASYAYVLLPGASAARTAELAAELAAEEGLEIVANTPDLQVVRVPRLGVTAANFWRAGTARKITVDQPCSIMISERGDTLSVAVSDPTQLQDSLSIELRHAGYRRWTGDDTITVDTTHPSIKLRVDTSGADGRTHDVTLHRT
ncbi:polysaccharide lyase family 8 super-sandwich domain-containing protein [Phytoactinopolyspora halotolerans]|uniref:Polysaccharide lyase 8 family protein n=1 Tax=Phytoactinopolyspora halotolerans TaxID=1981512 RepID=A0A6L9SCB8_9ACTN|nr:polysaccharide lyase family 8 super-sandwich domain-containing protein [Phytoactinopolyspora halotolerans]NEE02242.1 polysaccharide lyase 8 family protein [Phytoactinopolyspora halotolerans]